MMGTSLVALCMVLACATAAHAELFVCFQSARPLGSQFTYGQSDPLQVTDPNCTVVTKASGATAAQLALIHSTIRGAPAPKYLKVVSGLAVAMTTGEQDAVDTDLAAKAAAAQAFRDEVTTQDLCSSALLTEGDAKVDAFFDAMVTVMTADIATATTAIGNVTNIATAITAMTSLKNAITTVAQQLAGERVAFKKLLRCLLAVKKGAR